MELNRVYMLLTNAIIILWEHSETITENINYLVKYLGITIEELKTLCRLNYLDDILTMKDIEFYANNYKED